MKFGTCKKKTSTPVKVAEDKWKVRMIEEEFKKRVFERVAV